MKWRPEEDIQQWINKQQISATVCLEKCSSRFFTKTNTIMLSDYVKVKAQYVLISFGILVCAVGLLQPSLHVHILL